MINETNIHVRVPEYLRLRLNEEAFRKGISLFHFIRYLTRKVLDSSNSYQSTDFLFLLTYMKYNSFKYKDVCEYEIRHLLDVINKYYPNLERELQLLFDNVISDLEEVLKDIINDKENMLGSVSFGNIGSDIQVDFNKFYGLTDGCLPYC